jgi:hypothetical protein
VTKVRTDLGSLPNWNTQISSPQLFNMFVDKEGILNYTPSLVQKVSLVDCRAIWETSYDGGCYIVVTTSGIYRTKLNGSQVLLYSILDSEQPVDITENLQNEVTVVDGNYAYVIQQRASDTVTILSPTQGFALQKPTSCCTINSFSVILDGPTGIWQISAPNNALSFDPEQQQEINSQLFIGMAVREMNDNLFIFGTGGIERWEPSLNVNTYLFPLQKDTNYEIDFGAISMRSVVSNANTIYFLSSRFLPMKLTSSGLSTLWPQDLGKDNANQDENGIARALSILPDVEDCIGSFYTFRGNLFYQMTFVTSEVTWVWNDNANRYANTDDYIIGSGFKTEVVLLSDGVYQLSLDPARKARVWVGDTNNIYKGPVPMRGRLNGVELRQTQGTEQSTIPEYVELQLSIDRRTWTNNVRIPMGQTGEFNYRTVWPCNISAQYITPKIQYFGTYPFTIEAVDMTIN